MINKDVSFAELIKKLNKLKDIMVINSTKSDAYGVAVLKTSVAGITLELISNPERDLNTFGRIKVTPKCLSRDEERSVINYRVISQKLHELKALDEVAQQEQTKQQIDICSNNTQVWDQQVSSLIGDSTAVNDIEHTDGKILLFSFCRIWL